MTSGDDCPCCKEDVILVEDPTEAVWQLDPADYDDDAAVWLCTACGWNEEATDEEVINEADANLEWLLARLNER